MQFRTNFFSKDIGELEWSGNCTAEIQSSVKPKVKILHDLLIFQNLYIHIGMQVKELTKLLNIL